MDYWIFGYGSLVWRTGFPFVESRLAYAGGLARRYWQGSTDHRGLPGHPGRVVTLIRQAEARCLGMAYRLAAATADQVLADLDYREKGGYVRLDLDIEFADGDRARALTWVGWPDNPNYLGKASPGQIARQVVSAHGPSGANTEYVLKLAEFLRTHNFDDPHVNEIAERVLLLSSQPGNSLPDN